MPGNTPSENEVSQSRALFYDSKTGTVHSVANTDIPKARAAGYELALPVRDKDNNVRMIPASKVRQAQLAGFHVDLNAIDQTHKEGFWSTWEDVKNVVKAAPKMMSAAITPVTVSPYGVHTNAAGMENAGHVVETYKKEKEEGRSLPYRGTAALAGTFAGVDVAGMEHAADEGDTKGVLGKTVVPLTIATAPYTARAAAKPIGAAGDFLQVYAKDMYKSTLDIPKSVPLDQQNVLAQTGLKERVGVDTAGLEKSRGIIKKLNDQTADVVSQHPERTVDPNAVAKYTEETAQQAGESVTPKDDVAAVKNATQEYLEKHGQKAGTPGGRQAGFTGGETPGKPATPAKPYSVVEAQAEKSATYKRLEGDYGEQSPMFRKETQKALARGLKDKIIENFPELEGIGKREGALIDLNKYVEKVINAESKKPGFSLKGLFAGAATEAQTGSFGAGTAAYFATKLLRDPSFRSRIAIALNETGKVAGGMKGAFAKYDAWVNGLDNKAKEGLLKLHKSEKGTFELPLEKQVTNNASGESSASVEAINRTASEKAQGIKRFKIDTRSGKEVPLTGVDAADVKPGQYEVIVQRGPKGETLLDKGSKAIYKPVPAWPENYKPTTLKNKPGGGANYSEAELSEFKKKHNIK